MDARQFTKRAGGRIVNTPDGYPAFVPDPAPREVKLSQGSLAALGRGVPKSYSM